ncbi:PAS domain-containing protein [sulfur-oxidizing endosymbiont of Gigantopelta aegis]|uniref:PAS domain-containing protein n=1 Tax=sulfur-oxidizing endosymbiont of Gigantopelta aegis TaxID=2794934 RepID=UPI0018DC0215|nr:PAS domain-containing protein [sulfur-oxidizing endosymbiont of Gigantopelta aegis]
MDHTPAIIYAKDIQGHYLFCKSEVQVVFELTTEEVIGNTDFDIFPAEIATAFRKNDQLVWESGKAWKLKKAHLIRMKSDIIYRLNFLF